RERGDERSIQSRPRALQREPARTGRGAGGPRGPRARGRDAATRARGARLPQRRVDQARLRVPALARELPAGRRPGRGGPADASHARGDPGSRRRRRGLPRPPSVFGRTPRDERKAPVPALAGRVEGDADGPVSAGQRGFEIVEPAADGSNVEIDQLVDLGWHREVAGATVIADGRVHVEERRRDFTRFHLVHLRPPFGAPLVLGGRQPLEQLHHALVERAIPIAHREVRCEPLHGEIVGNGAIVAVHAGRLGMRLQVAEALVAVGIGPAREWIEAAGERSVGMDATTTLVEEHARAVFAGPEHGAARLTFGFAAGLTFALAARLAFALAAGLPLALTAALPLALAFGLALGLTVGLTLGLALRLALGDRVGWADAHRDAERRDGRGEL